MLITAALLLAALCALAGWLALYLLGRIICGDLIQSRTITAEEAVQKLQEALDMIYLEQGMQDHPNLRAS